MDFIEPSEAAELMHTTIQRLAQLRYRKQGPAFYKPTPRKVLYERSEVLAFVTTSRVATSRVAAAAAR